MKKALFLFICLGALTHTNAQTSKELIGKWQLIKWTQNNKEKNIKDYYKTDQVYQVFKDDGKFESLVGDETHSAKWKLLSNNKELKIISVLIPITFQIDYFDSQRRVISNAQIGTWEYKKIN